MSSSASNSRQSGPLDQWPRTTAPHRWRVAAADDAWPTRFHRSVPPGRRRVSNSQHNPSPVPSTGRGAQLLQQWLGCLIKERRLRLVTDLHDRYIGKARFPEWLHRFDDCIKIGTAWDLLGNVFGPNVLAGTFESGRGRQVGIYRPAATEPAELIMRSID